MVTNYRLAGWVFLSILCLLSSVRVSQAVESTRAVHSWTSHGKSDISKSLGAAHGDSNYFPSLDLNRDGVVNILDLGRHRLNLDSSATRDESLPHTRAIQGVMEEIIVEEAIAAAAPGSSFSVRFLLQNNSTPILGYSLDIAVFAEIGSLGTVTVDTLSTGFTDQNLIPEVMRDPIFSTIIDQGNGGVFVNAITIDNSTVLAVPGTSDVFVEVLFDVSSDACGSFQIQLGQATALADANAFAIPFSYTSSIIQVTASSPTPDPTVPDIIGNGTRNRILSVQGGNPGLPTAMRVRFVNLPIPFDVLNGTSMWAGPPIEICGNSGQNASVAPADCGPAQGSPPDQPGPTSFFSLLQCDPFYVDWSQFGVVNIHHQNIVPSSIYEIQSISDNCEPLDESSFSEPLTVITSLWGDVVKDCTISPCPPPDGSVDIVTDVTAILDSFRNTPGAPSKSRTDIEPAPLDFKINFTDVTLCLGAFSGAEYPFDPLPFPCGP